MFCDAGGESVDDASDDGKEVISRHAWLSRNAGGDDDDGGGGEGGSEFGITFVTFDLMNGMGRLLFLKKKTNLFHDIPLPSPISNAL